MPDPADLTATEARRRIDAGRLSPAALMEACLARVTLLEPALHSFAHLDPDAARAAAARPASGPLAGLPLGVKDVLDTADMPTGYGSPIWTGHRPTRDAAAVAAARDAGAVVIGKTVTTEFAVREPGPTTNPHDPARTPGGSSSGSAAGVAAGLFPFAFGTQTAGSIIRPAAFCGVVGYKPSFGTIDRAGMKVMSPNLDTIGAIARSVADCALLVGAVSGLALGDPDRHPDRPPRIGLCLSPAAPHASDDTLALLSDTADRLARAGATVVSRELPTAYADIPPAHALMMMAETAASLAWERDTHRARISAGLLERLDWAISQDPARVDAARALLAERRAAFTGVMEGVDILLTPSAPGEAPLGLGSTGEPVFNLIWTALHVPCVTIPAGRGGQGMPLGVQVVGAFQQDRTTLAAAGWVASVV